MSETQSNLTPLLCGEIYTLTTKVVVSHPLGSEELTAGDQVIYLGEFNDLPTIAAIRDGKKTNAIAPVIESFLTKLSNEVVDKAVELMAIYMDRSTSTNKNHLRSEVFTRHGYKFVRLAEHVLGNYELKSKKHL